MVELLTEWLDGVYFEGYTAQLQRENPEAFNFYLNEIKSNYGTK